MNQHLAQVSLHDRCPLICLFVCILFTCSYGCMPVRENPKYGFSNGIYKIKSQAGKKRAYIQVSEDQIQANFLSGKNKIDTTASTVIYLNGNTGAAGRRSYKFTKASFDLDFLSIPLKFRPGSAALPNQLTSNINGAVYVGRRADVFYLRNKQNPLGPAGTFVDHYGISFGVFTGLGSTAMNPWVTNNAISSEYEGAVIPVGVTGLFAVNNLTFGIASGIDHLLSRDRKAWIYTKRPWVGLSVGLNLN